LAADTQQQGLHVVARLGAAGCAGALHLGQRVVGQQLQDAHVVLGAAARPVLPLQRLAQVPKHGGQLPAPENVGVVQGGGPTPERVQIVVRIENLLVVRVRTRV
jgi:hypothetical protein